MGLAVTKAVPGSSLIAACTDTSTRPRTTLCWTTRLTSASSACRRRGRCTEASRKRWFTLLTVAVALSLAVSREAVPYPVMERIKPVSARPRGRSYRGILRGELELVEPAVQAARTPQELLVGADLLHLTRVHHHDAVRVAHGGQAMGDDQRGAALHEVGERLLHEALRLGV